GFAPAGQEQGFNAYMRESVPANTPLIVKISGTAPMQSSSQGGGAGGSGGRPSSGAGNAGSQDPSVNSRAEAGGDAATATATTIPARLDSLKWILVGGFAAIFALGFVYLLRRPQVVAATAGSGVAADAYETPAPKRAAKASSPSASAATVAAEVDREVRGSLDELKDSLFRL